MAKRDYKDEYAKFQSSPAEKKRRAGRNKARAIMAKKGAVRKGDGKDVDHRNHNALDSRPGNLRVTSQKVNRARNRKK